MVNEIEVARWVRLTGAVRDALHELMVCVDELHAQLSAAEDRLAEGDLEQAGVDAHDREVEAAQARWEAAKARLTVVPGA